MITKFPSSLRQTVLVASLLVSSVMLSGCGSGNSATVAAAPAIPTTVVLVHGAWADGSSWTKVTTLLQQRGMKVVAVQLQRASLAEDAAIVRRAIQAQSGQVILVGHSYGGAVITEAGTSDKVKKLVYVDAFAPGDNESINDLTKPYPTPTWQQNGIVADSAGYLTLTTDVFLHTFAADVPTTEAAAMASAQGPVFQHVLDDKVSNAAWKTKPSYFVVGTGDQIIPPEFQQGEAARIKAQVTTIPGASHVSMISHPTEVAAVILTAVDSVNGL